MTPATPPRIARALVSLVSEPDDRPWILADLDEEFSQIAATDPHGARRWAWRQAVTSLFPLARRRMQRRPSTPDLTRCAMFDGLRLEVRHGLRIAARTPVPTAAIMLTMALGIGATAAVSTVVWKVVLEPLPVRQPDHLLAVYRIDVASGHVIPSVAFPDLQDWRERTKSLVGIAPFTGNESALITRDGPVPINAVQVGQDFFAVLAPRLELGRAFTADEFADGAPNVVILSAGMWQRELGADRGIIGQSIDLAGGRATVVGVVAADAMMLPMGNADLWTPLHVVTSGPNAWQNSRGTQWLEAVARVRPDVTPSSAMAELRAVDAVVQREFPRQSNGVTVIGVAPLQDHLAGPVRPTLLFLAGATVLVLLVVCTNIANLRLAQAQARQREFAMRMVLGARFARLRRQVLTESMILALAGAFIGIVLARPLLRGLLALYPGRLPRAAEVHLDPRLIAWSIAVAVAAGVLFAVPQLAQLVRLDAGRVVKNGTRMTTTRAHRLARGGMVVVQLALSVVMLVSSGLLVRTFFRVTRVTAGFDGAGVLSFGTAAPQARYGSPEASEQLYQDLEARIAALPGVRGVGTTNAVPLTFNPWRNGVVPPNADPTAPTLPVNIRLVSPGYLDLMHVPLVRGRRLTAGDDEQVAPVALVNQTLASVLYPNEDPVGKVLRTGPNSGKTIVGVVGDIHHTSLTMPPDNEVYVPFRQAGARRSRVVAIRVDGDPARYVDDVRRAVRDVDPQLPIRAMQSLGDVVSSAIAPQRFRAAFIGSLAVLALVLAVIGVYGVMSYAVSERRRELGIRIALGDDPGHIRRRVIGEALQLAALGSLLGSGGAWMVTRAMQSFIFDVRQSDPVTLGAVAVVLTVVTVLAADGPARRASRVDPIVALRETT